MTNSQKLAKANAVLRAALDNQAGLSEDAATLEVYRAARTVRLLLIDRYKELSQ
jgi:hypothetical protein